MVTTRKRVNVTTSGHLRSLYFVAYRLYFVSCIKDVRLLCALRYWNASQQSSTGVGKLSEADDPTAGGKS